MKVPTIQSLSAFKAVQKNALVKSGGDFFQ